jgi:hypothetical protein
MHLILMGLGIASVAAGAAMLGFGISYNEFGTGNSLIGAGTTAVVGGLVIIGLAVAVGQLTRIAKALEPRAADHIAMPNVRSPTDTAARTQDRVDPAAVQVAPVAAGETKPEPSTEARTAAPTGAPMEASVAAESAQPTLMPPVRSAPKPRTSEPAAPASADTDSGRPPRGATRSEIPVVLSPRERGFDKVWPAERVGEASGANSSPTPAGDASRATRGSQSVTILKSGVIDGMAYTLYSDGSIEAELPQGVVRFATIEELRDHLGNSA